MKKNELRIGNYIYSYSEIYKVEMIDGYGFNRKEDEDPAPGHKCYQGDLPYMRGIRLTPEILEKCGFIDRSGTLANRLGFGLTLFERMEIVYYVREGYIRYQTKGNGFTHAFEHIKYLHQLQNLYFALTGKEFKIKL